MSTSSNFITKLFIFLVEWLTWVQRCMSSYTFLKSVGEERNPGRCLLFVADDIPLCFANSIPKSALTLRSLTLYIYMEHLFLMFLDHTRRRSTVGRTPLDE